MLHPNSKPVQCARRLRRPGWTHPAFAASQGQASRIRRGCELPSAAMIRSGRALLVQTADRRERAASRADRGWGCATRARAPRRAGVRREAARRRLRLRARRCFPRRLRAAVSRPPGGRANSAVKSAAVQVCERAMRRVVPRRHHGSRAQWLHSCFRMRCLSGGVRHSSLRKRRGAFAHCTHSSGAVESPAAGARAFRTRCCRAAADPGDVRAGRSGEVTRGPPSRLCTDGHRVGSYIGDGQLERAPDATTPSARLTNSAHGDRPCAARAQERCSVRDPTRCAPGDRACGLTGGGVHRHGTPPSEAELARVARLQLRDMAVCPVDRGTTSSVPGVRALSAESAPV